MPGLDTEAKFAAISPAVCTPRERSSSRISRRVGSAIAAKASLPLNDGSECLQVLHVPALLVALERIGGACAQALEAVMEDLDQGSIVEGRKTQGEERRDRPLVGRGPVALEGDLALPIQDDDGPSVVATLPPTSTLISTRPPSSSSSRCSSCPRPNQAAMRSNVSNSCQTRSGGAWIRMLLRTFKRLIVIPMATALPAW